MKIATGLIGFFGFMFLMTWAVGQDRLRCTQTSGHVVEGINRPFFWRCERH